MVAQLEAIKLAQPVAQGSSALQFPHAIAAPATSTDGAAPSGWQTASHAAASAGFSSAAAARPVEHIARSQADGYSGDPRAAPPHSDATASTDRTAVGDKCTCFTYTCALCKQNAARAAGSSIALASSDVSSSPGSCSSSPKSGDADRYGVPTISLAALEAEVKALYHIADDEEELALKKNRVAIEAALKQQEQEEAAAAAAAVVQQKHHAQTVPSRPGTVAAGAAHSTATDPAAVTPRRMSVCPAAGGKTKHGRPLYSWSEIQQHACAESCWLVVRGVVYDVTPMLSTHPAGIQSILRNAGTDAEKHYDFHSAQAIKLWKKYEIGYLEGYKEHTLCVLQ